MGLVGDLSSSRLRDELVALLEDPGAADGIRRLGELGADRAIHPHLRGDDEAAALFARATALRDELGVDVPSWRIGLAALARDMTSDEAYDWLDRLKVRRRDVDRIVGAITVAPRIVERLRAEPLEPAQVVALADPFAPDAPLLALALRGPAGAPRLLRAAPRTCGSRSAARISSRWALPSRRGSGRSSARSAGGSSTASSTGARRSSPRHVSSSAASAPA